MGSEIKSLTGLRGVAALWVAWHHICREPGFEAPFAQPLLLRGYLAVDLFFVLSGFVLSLAYADWFLNGASIRGVLAFMARRLARIWPLHAAVLLALLAVYHAVGGLPLPALLVGANLGLVQAWGFGASLNPSSWSLSTELAAYLLFPLLVPAVLRSSRNPWAACLAGAGLLALAVALAATATIKRYGPLDIPDDWSLAPLLRCLGGFVIGMTSYRLSRVPAVGALLSRPGAAGAACAGLLAAVAAGVADLLLYPLLPLLVAALATSRGQVARVLSAPPLHWLGVVSYALYLVHFPLLQIAIGGLTPSSVAAAALFVLMLGAALLVHLALELPGRRLGLALASWAGLGSRTSSGGVAPEVAKLLR